MNTLLFSLVSVVLCRQRALKALDERLSKVEQPLGWPSMDDAGTSSQDELASPANQVSSCSTPREWERAGRTIWHDSYLNFNYRVLIKAPVGTYNIAR